MRRVPGPALETMENHETAKPVARRQPIEETECFREHNAALIRKLEDKMLELEEANRLLECDIAERIRPRRSDRSCKIR